MSRNPRKVLIVDDEKKIVEVVKSYLEKEGFLVEEAYNGFEALEKADNGKPDIIILDLMLPDISGEEICKRIRMKSTVPIIMLTARIEEEKILEGLKIGADDYVTKPFSPRQLTARVEAVLRRTAPSGKTHEVLSFNQGDLVIDPHLYEVKKQNDIVNLTPNEFKILMTLVKFPRKAFTREELILMALGDDFDGYDRIIDTHIKNLRQKIESDARSPKYILTVHGIGYRFGGSNP